MMQEFVQEIQNTVQRGLRGIHTAMPEIGRAHV